MEQPKPTYHIITRRESLKAHLRKPGCPIKDSLHGDLSKVSSPSASHPIVYGKFVMDKHTKAENTQKIYL